MNGPGMSGSGRTSVAEERHTPLLHHVLFLLTAFLDLCVGIIGVFWAVQLVVFGLIYIVPPADFALYQLVGMENIPLLFLADFTGVTFAGFLVYYAMWRYFTAPLRRGEEVPLTFPRKVALQAAPLAVPPALLVGNWWVLAGGAVTKVPFFFLGTPLMGFCLGAFAGRLLALIRIGEGCLFIREGCAKRWRFTFYVNQRLVVVKVPAPPPRSRLRIVASALMIASSGFFVAGGLTALCVGAAIWMAGMAAPPYLLPSSIWLLGGGYYIVFGILMWTIFFLVWWAGILAKHAKGLLALSLLALLSSITAIQLTLVPLLGSIGGVLLLASWLTLLWEKNAGQITPTLGDSEERGFHHQ